MAILVIMKPWMLAGQKVKIKEVQMAKEELKLFS